ncbi:putative prolyl 4-hydroxylase 3 [Castilleja foliolosa]|uniref:procollagen-proline 4-dioxygenase n=1 Tax=Castilleja foliolosa TaxID=1961234 RepID=A0ABD3DAX0_9LAMI
MAGESEVEGLGKREDQWTEIVSSEPRAFIYHNFLSKEECEYLINLAKPHMKKSRIVDKEIAEGVESKARTSTGMALRRGQDKVVRAIEKRIADYTLIPVENGEHLQILHYEKGQKFDPHYDYFTDEFHLKNGGQRVATVLMYLSDVEKGGNTIFPNAKKGDISSVRGRKCAKRGVSGKSNISSVRGRKCAKRGVSVKPKMGDALLFWSVRPDGTKDPSSLHGARPVLKGNKWSCTKWMHASEYKV